MTYIYRMTDEQKVAMDQVSDIAEKQSYRWRVHVAVSLLVATHLRQCADEGLLPSAQDDDETARLGEIVLGVLRGHHDYLRLRQYPENN